MTQKLEELLPVIRRFAYSLTGTMADADDLLQSTVERVLTRDLPEDVDLLKWMFRVCRNLWIDEYRSRKVRQNAVEKPELQKTQIVDGESAIHTELEVEQVHQAMQKLPDDERSLLALIALQGMSYKDAATTLMIPIGTVMSRLARARRSLVEILNNNQNQIQVTNQGELI